MKKEIYFCDRCGKEIVNYKALENDVFAGKIHKDLCDDCCRELETIVNDWLTQKPEPVQEEAAPKAKGGRARKQFDIDMGKVGALKRAGWQMEKIAEEFGCSVQTLRNRIREELEKDANALSPSYNDPDYWKEDKTA